jgi:TonB family protein
MNHSLYPSIAALALASLALATEAQASPGLPLAPPPAPPKPPAPEFVPAGPPLPDGTHLQGKTWSDWMSVTKRVGDQDVKQFVVALLREKANPATEEEKSSFDEWTSSNGALSRLKPIRFDEGPRSGRWYFLYREGAVTPSDVVRLQVRPIPPYRVDAEVVCASHACKGVDDGLAKLAPPFPGNVASAELESDFRKLVASEDCVTGPLRQPPPIYPREEQRRGITGTTTIVLLYNRCGDVRMQSISKSSGNRNLDRSALQAASEWRVPMYRPGVSEVAKLDVEFRMDDEAPPAPP